MSDTDLALVREYEMRLEELEDAIEHGDSPETFRKQSLAIIAAHSQLRRAFEAKQPH